MNNSQTTNFLQKISSVMLISFMLIFVNSALAKSSPKEPTQCVYPGPLGKTTLYNNSYVALKSDPKTIIEQCEFGASCRQDKRLNNGKAKCVRSTTNKKSPYYNYILFILKQI